MARRGWRLMVASLASLLVLSGPCALALPTTSPVRADDQPFAGPFLNEGDWTGTLNAAGPFEINEFHGVVDYSGTFEFTVTSGSISAGTWMIDGAGGATHPRVTGTVTYEASGPMGGSADLPELLPGAISVTYDFVIDRMPVSGTTEFGASEMRSVRVPIISASCDFAVGDWELPANMAYARQGGSSSITGFWFAVRTAAPGYDHVNPAVLTPIIRGMVARAARLMEDATEDEEIDFDELDDLIIEAEFANQRLILATQCGTRPLRGWVNPVGPMIANLLRWAFTHPDLFSNVELVRLLAAGVRTGVVGSAAPANEATRSLQTLIAMELSRRAEQARNDDSCVEASQVYVASMALDDTTVTEVLFRAMREVCG